MTDLDFDDAAARSVSRLHLIHVDGTPETIELGPDDYVFTTIGSMTTDTTSHAARSPAGGPSTCASRSSSWVPPS